MGDCAQHKRLRNQSCLTIFEPSRIEPAIQQDAARVEAAFCAESLDVLRQRAGIFRQHMGYAIALTLRDQLEVILLP